MSRLTFTPHHGLHHDYYTILNDNEQYLGEIRAHRVGRFMQWAFCPAVVKNHYLFFTGPCQDEIRAFHKGMTKRHGRARLHFLER